MGYLWHGSSSSSGPSTSVGLSTTSPSASGAPVDRRRRPRPPPELLGPASRTGCRRPAVPATHLPAPGGGVPIRSAEKLSARGGGGLGGQTLGRKSDCNSSQTGREIGDLYNDIGGTMAPCDVVLAQHLPDATLVPHMEGSGVSHQSRSVLRDQSGVVHGASGFIITWRSTPIRADVFFRSQVVTWQ